MSLGERKSTLDGDVPWVKAGWVRQLCPGAWDGPPWVTRGNGC